MQRSAVRRMKSPQERRAALTTAAGWMARSAAGGEEGLRDKKMEFDGCSRSRST
jgi:hypothetical protein